MKRFSFIVCLLLLNIASAEECSVGENQTIEELLQDVNSVVDNNDMSGSCYYKDQQSRVAGWRSQVSEKIKRFQASAIPKGTFAPGLEDLMSASVDYDNNSEALAKEVEVLGAKFSGVTITDQNREAYGRYKALSKQLADQRQQRLAQQNKMLAERLRHPSMIQKLTAMAKKKNCVKDANYVFEEHLGFSDYPSRSEAEAGRKKEESYSLVEKDPSYLTLCTPAEKARSTLVPVNQKVTFDIQGDEFFANNQATLPEPKLTALLNKIEKELVSEKGCTKKIISFQVETSASQLANNYKGQRWNFLELSTDRGEFLKRALQTKFGVMASVDPTGDNGDGTSGPCPYAAKKNKDGDYEISRDFSKASSAELTAARYARVTAEIEDSCQSADPNKVTPIGTYYATKCYDVYMECAK